MCKVHGWALGGPQLCSPVRETEKPRSLVGNPTNREGTMEVKTSWTSQPSHLLAECRSDFLPQQILTVWSRRTIAQALPEVLTLRIMINQELLFKPLGIYSH